MLMNRHNLVTNLTTAGGSLCCDQLAPEVDRTSGFSGDKMAAVQGVMSPAGCDNFTAPAARGR